MDPQWHELAQVDNEPTNDQDNRSFNSFYELPAASRQSFADINVLMWIRLLTVNSRVLSFQKKYSFSSNLFSQDRDY